MVESSQKLPVVVLSPLALAKGKVRNLHFILRRKDIKLIMLQAFSKSELIRKIRMFEELYCAPRRKGKPEIHTNFEFGFKVCRACLTPDTVTKLVSVFDDGAKLAQMMKLVADVDVSFKGNLRFSFVNLLQLQIFKDHQKRECLMCIECSVELEASFNFQKKSLSSSNATKTVNSEFQHSRNDGNRTRRRKIKKQKCQICSKSLSGSYSLKRHYASCHSGKEHVLTIADHNYK